MDFKEKIEKTSEEYLKNQIFTDSEELNIKYAFQQGAKWMLDLAGATEALASQWRSVEDELPKAEQNVLVAIETQTNHQFAFAWLSSLSNGTLRWYGYDDTFPLDKIQYWMPIPDPPKTDKK